ncbi:hypothetical protein [Pseudomonas sp. GM25]|uniref:hypothetical protein n=1 Tax=Pseudomonas sp. GM25 TaxID=1144327 RepID=UPI00026FDA3B|nr:hypothetical protein [Pseudomonas sp. GM25]EJM31635.1 hypothetical protein PMI24_00713 [Pseudomonas sp. GM25]
MDTKDDAEAGSFRESLQQVQATEEGKTTVLSAEEINNGISATHDIYVTKDGYEAWLRVVYSYSADGNTFTCAATHYKATANNQPDGNVWMQVAPTGTVWNPVELTGRALQNGQWREITSSKTIVVNAGNATIGFGFDYDRAGVSDVWMTGSHTVSYIPATPTIGPNKNFTASTFDVTGAGGIAGANMVLDHGGGTLNARVQPTAGAWSVPVTVADNKNDQSIQAYQQVNGRNSARTGYITAYRAKLTSPTNNSIMPAKDFKFTGIAAPNTSVKVVQGGSGVVWSSTASTGSSSNWQASPLAAFSGSGEKYITAELDGVQRYTEHVTFRYLDYPSITPPGNNTEQEQTFTVSGNNRLANAEVRVFIDTTQTLVGTAPVGVSATWSAAVTLQPGLRRVAAEQFLSGKQSGRGGSVLYKIRPAKPVLQSRPKGEGIEFHGTGYATGRMHIHVSGDEVNSIDVDIPSTGIYTKDLPATVLPGNYRYGGRQSVSDGGTGRIYSSGWIADIPVAVPTSRPTSVSVTRNGNKLTITGRGNTWGTSKGLAIIHKDGQDFRPKFPNGEVQSDLTWRTTSVDLDPGTYGTLTVKQWVNGVWSAEVAVPEVTIPSSSPTYTAPDPDAQTNQTPTITGLAWTNSDVLLTIPTRPSVPLKATGTAGTIGSFSYTVTDPLPPKTYIISATSAMGGQTSAASNLTFTVQPPVPEPTTTGEVSIEADIEGKGWPGCWVEILSATHVTLGSGPVNEDKTWKIGIGKHAPGPLTFYCRQKEAQASSNVSGPTENKTVMVAVPRAGFTVPGPNGQPARKSTFSGSTSATYGSVELSIKGSSPFITSVPVVDGKWTTPVELAAGSKTLEVRVLQDGYRSNPTEITVMFVPNAPLLDTPLNTENVGKMVRVSGHGVAGDSVIVQRVGRPHNFEPVLVKADNTWSGLFGHNMVATDKIAAVARVGTEPNSQQSVPITLTLLSAPIDLTEPRAGDWVGPQAVYAGRAAPHAFIAVTAWYDTEVRLAPSTQADEDGYWRVLGNRDLPDGLTRVQVSQTLDRVNSEWRMSDAFTVQRITEIDCPVVAFPTPDQTVRRMPRFSGWGLPGAMVTVRQASGPVLATARVARDGTWEAQVTSSLPVGPLTYSAKQERDGLDSDYKLPHRHCDVTQALAGFEKAVIQLPLNDRTQVLETRPQFEGLGKAGALLTLYRHATTEVLAQTIVNAEDKWAVRCAVDLEVKTEPHQIAARQQMDGVESAWSGIVIEFKVGSALSPPVVVDLTDGSYVSRNAVIKLTAMPGTLVSLFPGDSTNKLGTGQVDETGRCVIVSYGLPLGELTLRGKAEKGPVLSGWMNEVKLIVADFG